MMAMPRLLPALLLLSANLAGARELPCIVIIIDDLGYQYAAGQRAIELPGAVSYAVLPETPSGRSLALAAHARGKEVLLHLPMQAATGQGMLDPGGITLDMTQQVLQQTFAAALESVPYAVGVSSHRGSLLTRHPGHMQWLMQEIAAHENMFFVDSYTTPASVALQIAAEAGVAATRRNVFLDSDREPAAIAREFERLTRMANREGVAIAIGHPYPETLDFLETALAQLDTRALRLIPVSEALSLVEPRQLQQL